MGLGAFSLCSKFVGKDIEIIPIFAPNLKFKKMKKILTLLLLALVMTFALPATAQEKKFFTPADASYNNRSLYAQRPNQLKWVGNTDILMKVKDKEIITMNPGSKKETTFLTIDELNA